MNMNIGFIGPGIMGCPIALNLLKHGYPLWAYARRPEALQPLIEVGATACRTPAEVASQTGMVIIMVSDTPT
jgi:2-hydroxy-3-oxopropionate reductase